MTNEASRLLSALTPKSFDTAKPLLGRRHAVDRHTSPRADRVSPRVRPAAKLLGHVVIDIALILVSLIIGRQICLSQFFFDVSPSRIFFLVTTTMALLISHGSYHRAALAACPGTQSLQELAVALTGSTVFLAAVCEAFGRPSSLLGSIALVTPALVVVPVGRAVAAILAPARYSPDCRVILVGSGRVAERLVARLRRVRGVTVVGMVDDDPLEPAHVIGCLADLPRLCVERDVDRVFVAFSSTRSCDQLAALRALGEVVDVCIVPRLYEMITSGSRTKDLFGIPVIYTPSGARGRLAPHVKRGIDVAVSLLLLTLLAPMLLAIAVAIKTTSPGPVLFRQARTGLNGNCFFIFKFRTMSRDAERRRVELQTCNEADGPIFKMRHDPRVTSIGRLLRKTSLDELPQLLNVVRGEMSLVGPRPLPVEEADLVKPSGGVSRTVVKPGMTGLWQVSGRSSLNYEDLQQLDSAYAASWNLRWDLEILLRTPACVLRRRGAC